MQDAVCEKRGAVCEAGRDVPSRVTVKIKPAGLKLLNLDQLVTVALEYSAARTDYFD